MGVAEGEVEGPLDLGEALGRLLTASFAVLLASSTSFACRLALSFVGFLKEGKKCHAREYGARDRTKSGYF